MDELQMAYRRMQQIRFCPPADFLKTPEGRKHLEACPFCQEWLEAGIEEWSLPEITPRPFQEVAPGQIWKISEKKSGWIEWKYYNPPLVLVTDTIDDKAVRVALLHDEDILAGEGDIPTGTGMYAEAWNTFAVPKEHLDKFITSINPEVVEKVRNAENIMPVPKTVVHEYFMKCEVEVASFFALSALEEIMKHHESLLDLFENGDIEIALPFSLPSDGSLLEKIALVQIPDDYCAMAAADEEDYIGIRMAAVSAGKLVELREIPAKITYKNLEGDRLIIGGKASERLPHNAEIYGVWKTKGECIDKTSSEAMIDEEGYFRVVFEELSEESIKKGEPVIIVCVKERNFQ